MAIFSEVASAWKSTMIDARARAQRLDLARARRRTGRRCGGMNTRPITLTTPTAAPSRVRREVAPRPGTPAG